LRTAVKAKKYCPAASRTFLYVNQPPFGTVSFCAYMGFANPYYSTSLPVHVNAARRKTGESWAP